MLTSRSVLIASLALVLTALAVVTPAAAQEAGTLDRALPRIELRTSVTPSLPARPRALRPVASDLVFPSQARSASASRRDSGPRPDADAISTPDRDLERLALAIGGALAMGALAEYVLGGERWGMDGAQAGAFAGGIVLASWGGIHLGGGGN